MDQDRQENIQIHQLPIARREKSIQETLKRRIRMILFILCYLTQ